MAMNNEPYFATRNPEGFLAMKKATAVDPATGKPDPQRLAAFLQDYPEASKYLQWAAQKPAPGGFAGATFYSINAFYLVNADSQRQPVRWMMRPHLIHLSLSSMNSDRKPTITSCSNNYSSDFSASYLLGFGIATRPSWRRGG